MTAAAQEDPVDRFLARVPDAQRRAGGWIARCPAHDDREPSLKIDRGRDGRLLLSCYAGCAPDAILAAVGMTWQDAFADRRAERDPIPFTAKRGRFERAYDYHNAAGELIFQAVRFADPKRFAQRRPDGAGGWVWNLRGVELELYRLPQLLSADPAAWVFLCEGEKDADRVAGLGFVATTNAMGAEKWRARYTETLRGRRVALLADNDQSGEKHVQKVAGSLHAAGIPVRVIWFEGLPEKGDVSDWLDLGHTGDDLRRLVETAADWPSDAGGPAATGADDTPDEPAKRGRKSQATMLVELVQASDAELWCTPDGEPYISVTIGERIEHHQLSSKACADLFGKLFYDAHRAVPGAQAIKDAAHALGGIARYEGERHPVFTRIGFSDGAIWIDLGRDDHRAVAITRAGWRVVPSHEIPIKFRRSQSMKELPLPTRGGSLDALWELFQIEGDERTLIAAWVVGCFQPHGARAFLEINGQQGSGKTTLLRMMINLIDPSHVDVRSLPKDEDSLIIAIRARAVLAFDNLSTLSPEMADAFCRTATGAGLGKRTLFSNDEETLLRAQLPLAWTGINSVAAGYGDLQDRTLSVTIGALSGESRKSELKLWTRFTELHADLLGALYDVLSTALDRLPDLEELEDAPRLADFASWVEAAAPALGWNDGDFLAALDASRARASQLTVDSSPIGDILLAMMREQEKWELTGTELLEELKKRADDERKRQRRFPKQPNHLTSHLRRIRPALSDIGIWVGFEHGREKRVITLERNPSKYGAASEPGPPAEEPVVAPDEPAPFTRAHLPGTCIEPDCDAPIEPPSNFYCRMHARGDVA